MSTECIETKGRLSACGVRSTYQRMRILESLKSMGHPNVKEIYGSLVREMPSLSKTTVYNTLDTLYKAGLVNILRIAGEETRYEQTGNAHCHFLCRKCGKIIDMSFACTHADSLRFDGFIVEELLGCFKGVCKACQTEAAKAHGRARKSGLSQLRNKRGR